MNYKIKVENNIDELVDLFKQLGCKYFNHTGSIKKYMFFEDGRAYFCKLKSNFNESKCELVTISELRDLVVLKRNSIDDANYENDGEEYFKSSTGEYYFMGLNGWKPSTLTASNLKPIIKEECMKEYLEEKEGGGLKLVMRGNAYKGNGIEVPKGAESYYFFNAVDLEANSDDFAFYKNGLDFVFQDNNCWDENRGGIEFIKNKGLMLWQRKETLNDKVATAETARQADKVLKEILEGGGSAWDTQVGGDHYKKYKIQPMEFALKNNLNPLQHSVLKYVMRHEDKNGKQDLEKAKHYIDLMIEYYYGNS